MRFEAIFRKFSPVMPRRIRGASSFQRGVPGIDHFASEKDRRMKSGDEGWRRRPHRAVLPDDAPNAVLFINLKPRPGLAGCGQGPLSVRAASCRQNNRDRRSHALGAWSDNRGGGSGCIPRPALNLRRRSRPGSKFQRGRRWICASARKACYRAGSPEVIA